MAIKRWGWSKRIMHGPGRMVPLDFGKELWKWDVTLYESRDGIVAWLNRSERPFDDDRVIFEATRTLLGDVVDAAGGLEQSIMRLRGAMNSVQELYGQWSATIGEVPDGAGITDPTTEDAWYALEESLVWARTLDDRLRRLAVNRCYPDQGLIPALADGPLRDAVIVARARLLEAGMKEARYLSGLNLHMQSIQAGSKGARVHSGRVLLPFPDQVDKPISHRWQLTFDDDRDALSFSNNLMASLELFMDEMLEAFEQHVPERFRFVEG